MTAVRWRIPDLLSSGDVTDAHSGCPGVSIFGALERRDSDGLTHSSPISTTSVDALHHASTSSYSEGSTSERSGFKMRAVVTVASFKLLSVRSRVAGDGVLGSTKADDAVAEKETPTFTI